MKTARAFGPATVGNAAVGFDVLGFAVDAVGDRVTVGRTDRSGVQILDITGAVTELPRDPSKNTATVPLLRMLEELNVDGGFEVWIEKGIPLGSGMGGSAASAVAAVVAAAATLDTEIPKQQLFEFALEGEGVASGHAHPDNVAPCLYGGLTFTQAGKVTQLPTPELAVVLVHPELTIETKAAREVLPTEVSLHTCVRQMAHLAAFVDACHRGDAAAAAANCVDLLAEPHRKSLVRGFDLARDAALDAGASAFSLSGSGPTVFALIDPDGANGVAEAIVAAFASAELDAESWVSKLGAPGARIET